MLEVIYHVLNVEIKWNNMIRCTEILQMKQKCTKFSKSKGQTTMNSQPHKWNKMQGLVFKEKATKDDARK